ncbi:MAG: BtpA/SgcQ family protein [Sandaracinaceae bacterium]
MTREVPRGLIGVVHLPALPSDPGYRSGGFEAAIASARRDAQAYAEGGASALIIENFGSAPFPKGAPEQPTPPFAVAAIARAVEACRGAGLPIGVNVLRNDAEAAMGIAAACGCGFVRVNVHIGVYVTDQGLVEGRAYDTLRLRARLGADVAICADVRVKHAAPLAARPIEEEVDDLVRRGGADAVIVTGRGTGHRTDPNDVAAVHAEIQGTGAAVWVGSGVTVDNVDDFLETADGVIVGTSLKRGGQVDAPVDPARVRALAERIRAHGD